MSGILTYYLLIIRVKVSSLWFVSRHLDVLCQYADLSIYLEKTRNNILQFIFLLNILFMNFIAESIVFS